MNVGQRRLQATARDEGACDWRFGYCWTLTLAGLARSLPLSPQACSVVQFSRHSKLPHMTVRPVRIEGPASSHYQVTQSRAPRSRGPAVTSSRCDPPASSSPTCSLCLSQLDLQDDQAVKSFFQEYKPDVVVHCAAERRPDAVEAVSLAACTSSRRICLHMQRRMTVEHR